MMKLGDDEIDQWQRRPFGSSPQMSFDSVQRLANLGKPVMKILARRCRGQVPSFPLRVVWGVAALRRCFATKQHLEVSLLMTAGGDASSHRREAPRVRKIVRCCAIVLPV